MESTKPTRSVSRGLNKVPSCVNCGDTPCRSVFESLLLCDRCYYNVHFLLKKCKREFAMAFDVYKKILRAAALEKKLLIQKGMQDVQKSKATTVRGKM